MTGAAYHLPRQHIFMHSAHTTFIGTPLPQHSLLSGQTWWGPHTWRDPSGKTVNDIHDPHKPSNWRSMMDVSWIFAQHFPKLGPDLTDGTPYTTNLHVFLRPCLGSMNIISGGSGDSSNGLVVRGFASEVHGHIFKCGSHSTSTYTFCFGLTRSPTGSK